jgi:cadmium resistance protein CadD (predicted permease)
VQVVVGQYAGIAGLIGLSLAGSLLALVVPTAYIGLINFVPLAIGVRGLLRGLEAGGEDDGRPAKHGSRVANWRRKVSSGEPRLARPASLPRR